MISTTATDRPDDDGFSDILRALALCHPGARNVAPLTLDPANLDQWRAEIFGARLWPAMLQAWNSTVHGRSRELADSDRTLDAAFLSGAAIRSRAAGASLLAAYRPPSAERSLDRYSRLVEEGVSPGHLAIVMAARGAIFRIAPRLVAAAYVVLEMRAAGCNEAELSAIVAACLADTGGPTMDLMAA